MTAIPVVLERAWVRVGGVRLHARVADRAAPAGAPVVVCVHGLVVSGRYMVPLAGRLAPVARVYVPDLPGSGRSGDPVGVPTIGRLAEALAGWMGALGLPRAVVVGNSLGSQVVIRLARDFPRLVAGVVLIGPTVDPAGRSTPEQLRRLALDMLREPPASFGVLLQDLRDAGVRLPLRTWLSALEDRPERHIAGVAAPLLVMRGGRDPISPEGWAGRLAGLAPRGRLAQVAGAAHIVHYSHPDEVARLVLGLVRQVAPAGGDGAGADAVTAPPARR